MSFVRPKQKNREVDLKNRPSPVRAWRYTFVHLKWSALTAATVWTVQAHDLIEVNIYARSRWRTPSPENQGDLSETFFKHHENVNYIPHTAVLHILADKREPGYPEYMFLQCLWWFIEMTLFEMAKFIFWTLSSRRKRWFSHTYTDSTVVLLHSEAFRNKILKT
jgi:hypothetical protein